jgi:hypothetical protein
MKLRCIACVMLSVSLGVAMYYNVRWNLSLAHTKFGHQYDETDQTARKLAPAEGNLALGFQGYNAQRPADADFAARLYFRSSYILYPQLVFATVPDGTLINTGDDILLNVTAPGGDWLHARDVRTLAVFQLLPTGESSVRPIPIQPPTPPASE